MKEDTRIICCKKEVKYNYCPVCGKPKTDIVRDVRPLYPIRFTTYAIGDRDDPDKLEVIKYLELPEDHLLTVRLHNCDKQVKLDWDIDKNHNIILVSVNDILLGE